MILLIIDLEATCWDDKGYLKDLEYKENEIIEIGATILKLNDDFLNTSKILISKFVKPIKNPILTDFCTELTSITQKQVDNAKIFPAVLKNFINEVEKYLDGKNIKDVIFVSWGEYDRKQFIKDCELHNIEYPFGKHINIKKSFSKSLNTKRGYGLKKALKKIGLEFEGNHHRGVDDANNIARLIIKHFGKDIKDYL